MNLIFRLFLTFNSTSLIIVVYLIKMGVTIRFVPSCLMIIPNYVSYIIYILISVLLTFISLLLSKYLDFDSVESEKGVSAVKAIELANNSFLPSYLGYFFVALSVPNFETLSFVFAILFVFTFLSQTLYFNRMFLLFGFHFFLNLTTHNDTRVFLITKKKLKNPNTINFPSLKRINDFTFIDNDKQTT